jgi:hypothetical protein
MATYYYFSPHQPRLVRAWRRDMRGDNTASGGHLLETSHINLYPRNLILRHYVALNKCHAARKYVGRRFDEAELAKGWHFNRVAIKNRDLALQPSTFLRTIDRWDSVNFDLSAPAKTHFWEWSRDDVMRDTSNP